MKMKKYFLIRFGFNLFWALMFSVVGGVTYQPTVEKPLSLYYNAEVTNVATNYSYGPGQSGTTFDFFIKKANKNYGSINLFSVVAIPTVLYFGLFTLIGLVRKEIQTKKPSFETPQVGFKGSDYYKKMILKNALKDKKPVLDILVVLVCTLFFYCGMNGIFGLGLSEAQKNLEMNSSFFPSNATLKNAKFGLPHHIIRDNKGDFLISDLGNHVIRKIIFD